MTGFKTSDQKELTEKLNSILMLVGWQGQLLNALINELESTPKAKSARKPRQQH